MGKQAPDRKKKRKKDSQLVIRIEAEERDAFVTLCDRLDTSAAREIRRFMREWVAAHAPAPASVEPEVASTDSVQPPARQADATAA